VAFVRRALIASALLCVFGVSFSSAPVSASSQVASNHAAVSPQSGSDPDIITFALYRYEANTNLCTIGCGTYIPPAYWSTAYGTTSSAPSPGYDLDVTLQAWIAPSQVAGTAPLWDCKSGISISGGGGGSSVTGFMNDLHSDCDGHGQYGIDGYIYTAPNLVPAGTHAVKLYRCEAQVVAGGDLFMTTTSPDCEGVTGYSINATLGWGLSSSYDYTTNNDGQTGTTSPGGCSPTDHLVCLATTPVFDPGTEETISVVPPGTPCLGGVESTTNGVTTCIAQCETNSSNNCGSALGTFAELPPMTPPSGIDYDYTPEVYNTSGQLQSPATLIVGDAASSTTGTYSETEANLVYTVLALCTEQDGFSPPDLGSYKEPEDLLGQINDAAAFFSLSEAQIEAGTVTWVPPECDQWYANAPQVYDEAYDDGLASTYLLDDLDMPPAGTFATSNLEKIAGIGTSSTSWAGFLGTDCGSGSTGSTCTVDTVGTAETLLPYELAMGTQANPTEEMVNALQAASIVLTAEYQAMAWIGRGCGTHPAGQIMVMSPIPDASTADSYDLLMSVDGTGAQPAQLECILPEGNCATSLKYAQENMNNMDAYLAGPSGSPTESTCTYAEESADTDIQVEWTDNVDQVAAQNRGWEAGTITFVLANGTVLTENTPQRAAARAALLRAAAAHGIVVPKEDQLTSSSDDLGLTNAVGLELPFQVSTAGSAGIDTTATLQAPAPAIQLDPRTPSQTSDVDVSSATPAAGSYEYYTATVAGSTNPTGTVTFTDNNAVICENVPIASNGVAECVAQVGNTGTHTIAAGYSGDSLLAPSVSPDGVDIQAGPANQSINLSPIFAQQAGNSVNLSGYATASSGLPVSFSASSSPSGICSVSGTTLSLSGAGTCTVMANQAGNENYAPAPQASRSFSVSSSSLAFTMSPSTTFTGANQNIVFGSTLTNTGNTLIQNISVTSSDGTAVTCDSTALSPSTSTPCFNTYPTTAADVAAGEVTDSQTATGTALPHTTVTASSAVEASFVPQPEINMTVNTYQNDYTGTGQNIEYSYLVDNGGNVPLSNVSVSDNLGVSCPSSTLAPGAEEDCTASHTTTAADVAAGVISDSAQASGTSPAGTVVTGTGNDVLYYVGVALSDTPEVNQFNSYPFPVTFDDTVTNTSGLPLTGIAVIDESDSQGASCPDVTLDPGQSEVCTYTHTSSDTDVGNGVVNDHAEVTASVSLPSGNFAAPPEADAMAAVPYAAPSITFTSAADIATTPGTVLSFTVKANSTHAAIWATNLPPGMTFTGVKKGKGTLAGTPTGGAGNYPIHFTAENTSGTGEQTLYLDVDGFTSPAKTTFISGQADSYTITAAGGPPGFPLSFSVNTADLPKGITFADNGDQTATLSGTPHVSIKTVYKIPVTISDQSVANGADIATQTFKLTVKP
jgi:hypothetical protein